MTSASAPRPDSGRRPTPISRVWAGARVLAEDLEGEDLADVLQLHAKAQAWWVITEDDQELRRVTRDFGLDDYAVDDLVKHAGWTAYEELDRAAVLGLKAATLDPGPVRIHARPLSMIMTDQLVVCLAPPTHGPSGSAGFSPARVWTDGEPQLARHGVEGAVQVMIFAVIASHEETLHWLEDQADRLTNAIFEERPLTRTEQLTAFRLRAALSQLRRLTDPMRTAVTDLVDSTRRPDAETRTWNKVIGRQERLGHAIDALRDSLNSVFQTSLALNDERANQIMKKLTGWAAIIAVPTLVTGFVGMNVAFPLDGTRLGFWVYLVIMIVPLVALFAVFKRHDWI